MRYSILFSRDRYLPTMSVKLGGFLRRNRDLERQWFAYAHAIFPRCVQDLNIVSALLPATVMNRVFRSGKLRFTRFRN